MKTVNAYTAPPPAHLRIGLLTRILDAWDARRNAAAEPARPSADDKDPSTPRIAAINHHHRDSIHGEWLAFLKDTADHRIEQSRIRRDLENAAATLESLKRELDAATAALPGSDARPGEEDLAPASIERRRRAEHARHVSTARSSVTAATQSMQELSRREAELFQRIRERLEAARTRATRIHERDAARIDRYRAVLCRRHPQGQQLNSIFTTSGLTLPAWVTTSDDLTPREEFAWAA
jgi:hypothetical protein